METFVDRMIEERNELEERLTKGMTFTRTDDFSKLSATERYLLEGQLASMHAYYNYLQLRINYYK